MPDLPLLGWVCAIWALAVFALVIAGWRWQQQITEEEQG